MVMMNVACWLSRTATLCTPYVYGLGCTASFNWCSFNISLICLLRKIHGCMRETTGIAQ